MQYPIPDYPPNQRLYLLCWPDSLDWSILLRGLLTEPERGRFWDGTTGNIKDTQAYAKENITLMDCNDLLTVLTQIRDSIAAVSVVQGNIYVQATASAEAQAESAAAAAELNLHIVNQVQAIALSQSWSQSIAQATASIEVYNQVNFLLPTFDPADPPDTVPVLEDAGFTGVVIPQANESEFCDRATWAVDFTIGWIEYIVESRVTAYSTGVLAVVVGYLGSRLAQAAGGVGHQVAQIAAIVGATVALLASGLEYEDLVAALDALKAERDAIICTLYRELINYEPTRVVRLETLAAVGNAATPLVPLFGAIFNASVVGMMYLRFTTEDFPAGDAGACNSCLA